MQVTLKFDTEDRVDSTKAAVILGLIVTDKISLIKMAREIEQLANKNNGQPRPHFELTKIIKQYVTNWTD